MALRKMVKDNLLSEENWEIIAIGEDIQPVDLGNNVFLRPMPWMSYLDYAAEIRNADLLLSLMLSPHPSYPPLEMASSGNLTVTNSYSVKTKERMAAISSNILVAEPSVESVSIKLKEAISRINYGLNAFETKNTNIGYPKNWDEAIDKLMPNINKIIKNLREGGISPDKNKIHGFPTNPKSDYEHYRISELRKRRSIYPNQREKGLITLATSAFNTDARFLRELASSIYSQDGGMNFEWLILDNGSTDPSTIQTLKEISRFNEARLITVKKNLGIIGGMRLLLEEASGKYILPIDSDDVLAPESTRAFIAGTPKLGNEHHSSLPTIILDLSSVIIFP